MTHRHPFLHGGAYLLAGVIGLFSLPTLFTVADRSEVLWLFNQLLDLMGRP